MRRILDNCTIDSATSFANVLLSIYTQKEINVANISKFNYYLEHNESILNHLSPEDESRFFQNIMIADVKLEDLNETDTNNHLFVRS